MGRASAPRRRLSRGAGERGAAAVEMAMAFPLLVFLLVGVADVGWMVWQRIQLQEATQEAAIFAAYNPSDHETVRDRVGEASDYQVDPAAVTVSCEGDRRVNVAVVHEHRLLFGLLLNISTTLRTEVTADVLVLEDCDETV